MKKNRVRFLLFAKFFLITVLFFSLPKTFLYADQNLTDFQKELIQSKQKVPVVPSLNLQDEAQLLMDELVKKGYSAPPKSISIQEVEYKPVKITASSGPLKNKPIKSVSLYKKPKTIIKSFGLFNIDYDKPLSEGESLYRVAISDQLLTLKEAQEIAVSNSAALLAFKKKIDVAESKLFEAKRALFPTLQVAYQENGGIFNGRFYRGRNQKINLNQPLFYGGELILTVKQAEENLKSAKKEYSKNRAELLHQMRTSYYGVVKAEYNLRYQNELFNKASIFYNRIQKEHENKIISEIDYLNVESQFHQIHFNTESSQNDLLTAKLLLNQSLGLMPDEKVPVDLKLNFTKVNVVFDEMLEVALKNNPDLQIKEYAYKSSQLGLQIYEAKKLPRWDLRGSFGYLGEALKDDATILLGKSDEDLEKEWFLGIKGSLPIWGNSIEYDTIKHVYAPTVSSYQGGSIDWNHTVKFNLLDKISDITDEKQAQAAYYQAKSEYEKARNEMISKLREDFYNLQKSLIQVDASIAKVNYQEKQNRILEYMLSMQETQAAGLMEGWIEAAQDKYAFIQAVSDYKIALSSLSTTIGDPDYFEAKY